MNGMVKALCDNNSSIRHFANQQDSEEGDKDKIKLKLSLASSKGGKCLLVIRAEGH